MNVTWLSPSSGETYTPGQSIIGKWMTSQSLSNPAFRLCSADGAFADDPEACGQAIWPPVQQTNSSYQVSLAVPDVSTTSEFYLIMEDNRGNTFSSPVFSLSSSHQEPSQSPERSEAQNEDAPSLQSFSPLDNINAEVAAPEPVAAPPSTTSPLLSQNRIPIPVAAYAVPLAVAGIIILVGLIVLIVQRRKLHLERSIPNPQSATSRFFTRAQTIMRPTSRKEKQAFYSNNTNITDSPMMRSVNEKSHQTGVQSDIFTSVYLPILSRKRTATREPFKQHYINPIPIPIPPSGLVQHDNPSTSRSAMSRIAVPARIIRAATSRFISSRFYRRGEGNVVEVQRVEKIQGQGQGQGQGQTHLRPSHHHQQQQPRIHQIRRDRREDREVDVDSIMSHYMDASPELDHLEEVDLRNMEHTPNIRQPQQQQHSYVLPMPKDVHLRREASDRDDVWFVEFDSERDHHVPVRDAHAARYEREYR
ncbi:hypothetical protein ABKN59_010885 [Abortiporus biennis]